MSYALLPKASAFQSFTQFFKCRLACYTVNAQAFDSLESFNRALGACSKITAETACIVTTANKKSADSKF